MAGQSLFEMLHPTEPARGCSSGRRGPKLSGGVKHGRATSATEKRNLLDRAAELTTEVRPPRAHQSHFYLLHRTALQNLHAQNQIPAERFLAMLNLGRKIMGLTNRQLAYLSPDDRIFQPSHNLTIHDLRLIHHVGELSYARSVRHLQFQVFHSLEQAVQARQQEILTSDQRLFSAGLHLVIQYYCEQIDKLTAAASRARQMTALANKKAEVRLAIRRVELTQALRKLLEIQARLLAIQSALLANDSLDLPVLLTALAGAEADLHLALAQASQAEAPPRH